MVYLAFLGGVIFGTIVTRVIMDHNAGKGHFKIEPYEDDSVTGFYKVNVCIVPNQDLLKKNMIILYKDDSPK